MPGYQEIRALFDEETITVYQAYNKKIAEAATCNNKFVEPFSFNRMTWIKPSFLWMMERSNWGSKANQECTLAIKLRRNCFENALSEAVLTSPDKKVYPDSQIWRQRMKHSRIHVQWDPERDIRGNKLNYRSVQIGISRHLIKEFNDEWIVRIEDISALVTKIHNLNTQGKYDKAKSFLPIEKPYPLKQEIREILGM